MTIAERGSQDSETANVIRRTTAARLGALALAAEEADERRARAIIEQYQDEAFSYCDAVSFAVMERLDISEAIAFDEHFRQYGQFTLL